MCLFRVSSIYSISSGDRQRKTRGTLKEQERYKRYLRGRTGEHERNNRGTEDVQQRYKRCATEVQQRLYTELRIHNTIYSITALLYSNSEALHNLINQGVCFSSFLP